MPCPSGSFPYIVQQGDTYYSLAKRYGTTVAAITAANPGVNPDNLQIGQVICIPGIQPTPCPAGSRQYIIRAGDTLYSISQRYNVPVDVLIAANPGINPDNLQIGQVICIPSVPACPPGSVPYAIKAGDTYYSLAQKHGITVNDLIAANPGVDPNNLQIGEIICIPVKK